MCVIQARDLLHCPFFVYNKSTSPSVIPRGIFKWPSSTCTVGAVIHEQLLQGIIQGRFPGPGRQCLAGTAGKFLLWEGQEKQGQLLHRCSHCTWWDTKSILPWPRGCGTQGADAAHQYLLQNDPGNTQLNLHSQDVPDLLPTCLFSACDFPRRNMEALHTLYNTRSHLNTSLFGSVLHLHNSWFFSLALHYAS